MKIDSDRLTGLADVFFNQGQYQEWHRLHADALRQRWLVEQNLGLLCRQPGCLPGWSGLSHSQTQYRFTPNKPDEPLELREQLICARTGLSARLRLSFQLGLTLVDSFSVPAYISEQASAAYRWLKQRLPQLQGSEYFAPAGEAKVAGKLRYLDINETPHFQDIMALSFDDSSFKLALSFDVLEHVHDFKTALAEMARVLKPGGYLVLTAPFMHDRYETMQRAKLDDNGEIVHLIEPEYHLDPVSTQGVLCFQTFGWDLLDAAREAGFHDAAMVHPWDISLGLIGGLWCLVARR